jgi:hypothetical protein
MFTLHHSRNATVPELKCVSGSHKLGSTYAGVNYALGLFHLLKTVSLTTGLTDADMLWPEIESAPALKKTQKS